MQAFSLVPRVLLKSSRLAALGLLVFTFVTTAEAAAQSPPVAGGKAQICDPHVTTLRSLRVHGTKAGPVAKRERKPRGVLLNTTPRLRRGSYNTTTDDDEAIQSDSPAAHAGLDEQQAPALRALGLLSSSLDRLPFDRPFSPRSPRGPPPTT